jgi:hypothetical protein
VPFPASGKLTLFDIRGKRIRAVERRTWTKGGNQVMWNIDGLPVGIYLVQLDLLKAVKTIKIAKQ